MVHQKTLIISAAVFVGLFCFSLLLFNYSQKHKARQVLFFPETRSSLLTAEIRNVPKYKEDFRNLTALVEELLNGPAGPDKKKIFPPDTKLISLFVADKILTINFSYDILKSDENNPYSLPDILQTLVNNILYNYKSIKNIIFYIEGELVNPEIEKSSGETQKMYIPEFDKNLLK